MDAFFFGAFAVAMIERADSEFHILFFIPTDKALVIGVPSHLQLSNQAFLLLSSSALSARLNVCSQPV